MLAVQDPVFQPILDAKRQPQAGTAAGGNETLLRLGVREDVCQDVLNPGLCFSLL